MRKRALVLAMCFGALGAFAALSCGGDDTPSDTGPKIPPSFSIVELRSVGGPSWKPGDDACIEVGRDPNATIAVLLAVNDFTLRPPDACGSARQCGTAVLRVDPSGDSELLRVEAAQTTLSAAFQSLPLGSHTFHVELILKSGEPVFNDDAGQTLFSEVTLDVKAPGGCGGTISDGGTDASDAASDAPAEAASDAPVGDAPAQDATDAAEDAAVDAAQDAADDAAADATGE